MKVEPCFRCQHLPGEKDKFCVRCGAPLKNTCTNRGGLLGEPCKKINPPQAVFCASCGAYTTFYKAGILTSPYTESNLVHNEEDLEEMQDLSHYFFKG